MQNLYVNIIDFYNSNLKEIIKLSTDKKQKILLIKNENNKFHVAFLDDIAKKIKEFDSSIKTLSNNINSISILEFNSLEDLVKILEINQINKEDFDFLKTEVEEEKGLIFITTYKMDIYKSIKINNKKFLNEIKKLLLIEDDKLKSFINYWSKTKLYYANINHYFNQKITEKNFTQDLLNYSVDENFNLVVNSELFEEIKKKHLPKQFKFLK